MMPTLVGAEALRIGWLVHVLSRPVTSKAQSSQQHKVSITLTTLHILILVLVYPPSSQIALNVHLPAEPFSGPEPPAPGPNLALELAPELAHMQSAPALTVQVLDSSGLVHWLGTAPTVDGQHQVKPAHSASQLAAAVDELLQLPQLAAC